MSLATVSDGADAHVQQHASAPPANRMAAAILALIGVVISAYMSLYSIGAIADVACGTGSCAVVQNSPWAVFAGMPVPFWGLGGYGAIFALALLGTRPARAEDRRIGGGLLVLATIAAVFSAYLSWVEAVLIEAWCRWCIASAVVAALLLLAALPELGRLNLRKERP